VAEKAVWVGVIIYDCETCLFQTFDHDDKGVRITTCQNCGTQYEVVMRLVRKPGEPRL